MTEAELAAQEEEEVEIDLSKTVLRCERQTLHRLPKTKALVFAFVSSRSQFATGGGLTTCGTENIHVPYPRIA
jgi:hypothetical protein